MITRFLTILLVSIIAHQSFAADYVFSCSSAKISFKLSSKMTLDKTTNGWTTYWGAAEYTVEANGEKSTGVVTTNIMTRGKGPNAESVTYISLLDDQEAQLRKQGIEGGSVGFASVDIRQKIEGTFKARWSVNKPIPNFKNFMHVIRDELTCQRLQ